jgi:hypothetical protein
MNAAVSAAREELKDVTPLKRDCGRVCGARCCRSLEGEETGMLLFPGEAEAYAGRDGFRVRKTARGDLLLCSGTCNRADRPLSCRLFPLLPLVGDDGSVRVAADLRALAVCPLARQGKSSMDPAFIEAVRRAGEILAAEDEQALFLEMLEREQEELKRLKDEFTGHNA